MMPQPISPRGHDVSPTSGRNSFWWGALLGLPVVNAGFLGLAAAIASGLESAAPLILAVVVLALAELAVLIPQSRRHGVGGLGLVAAIIGNAVMTTLGFVLVLFVLLLIACSDGQRCFG